MTRKVRREVESVLAFEDVTAPSSSPPSEEIKAALLERGFSEIHSAAAASRHKTAFDGLCWLVKNLDEGKLPEKYRPGDGGGLSVVSKSDSRQSLLKKGTLDPEAGLGPDVRRCLEYGVPRGDVEVLLAASEGDVFEACHAAFTKFCGGNDDDDGDDKNIGTLEEQVSARLILLYVTSSMPTLQPPVVPRYAWVASSKPSLLPTQRSTSARAPAPSSSAF